MSCAARFHPSHGVREEELRRHQVEIGRQLSVALQELIERPHRGQALQESIENGLALRSAAGFETRSGGFRGKAKGGAGHGPK